VANLWPSQLKISSVILRLIVGFALGSVVYFTFFIAVMTFAFRGINDPPIQGFWGSVNFDPLFIFISLIIAPVLSITPLTLYLKNKLTLLKIVTIDLVLMLLLAYFFYHFWAISNIFA